VDFRKSMYGHAVGGFSDQGLLEAPDAELFQFSRISDKPGFNKRTQF